MAKAIGDIMSAGIKVSLVDINNSDFGFKPDVKNNQILFGMKALLNVSDDTVRTIIANRPYASPKDFYERVHPTRQAMVSLIKGGAFDNMMDRKVCMGWYIWETCDKKKRITLQNLNGLMKANLVPQDTIERQTASKIFEFTRYLKVICLNKTKKQYVLDERAITFLQNMDYDKYITADNNGVCILSPTTWDKIYQKWMDVFRNWIAADKDNILQHLNETIFLEDWNKYASGNLSSWEMEALCFYYHEHELAHIDKVRYGIKDFNELPEEPEVEKSFVKGGREIHLFKLSRICGTCIAKNKTKSIVTILTQDGTVDIKFAKNYFALFDKQISARGEDGVKHVVEKSWFNRGSMIMVMGIRSGDDFITKKYSMSTGHQLYKIDAITANNELVLRSERYQGESEEDV